jgi:hypothetical protein
MPDIDVPQARHAVDDPVSVGIPKVDAFAPDDDPHAVLVEALRVGERVQMVGRIDGAQLRRRQVGLVEGHGARASRVELICDHKFRAPKQGLSSRP